MYVLRRTIGTSISIRAVDVLFQLRLVGIDWLGGCALIDISRGGTPDPVPLEMAAGQVERLHPDVQVHLLTIARGSHEGTPAQVVEFGFDAPRSIPIYRSEKPPT